MKKLIAVFMALVLCTGCLWAAAEEPEKEEIPMLGITFTYPKAMIEAKGIVGMDEAVKLGDGVYYDYCYYSTVTPEEWSKAFEGDEQAALAIQENTTVLFYVFAIAEGKDFSAVTELVGESMPPEKAVQIGKAGNWTYYLFMMDNSEFSAKQEQEYADELAALSTVNDELIAAFAFSEPFNEYGKMDGRVISFTAKDLDGNEISSSEIFAQHEITMVNVWATWCGPCIGELAELQKIHTRFLEKDCAVVGLLTDTNIDECRSLMKQNGVTYQVVLAPKNFGSIFPFDSIPTSFFVDREGRFLGTKIVGAYPDMYESALEPLLKK